MACKSSSWKTYYCLAITIVLWASAFVGIRIGLAEYNPGALALLRFLTASIVMLLIYFRLPNRQTPTFNELVNLLMLGVCGIGIYNIALNYGELSISAGIASFIVGLMPVFTIGLSVVLLKEAFNHRIWHGIGVSMVGMVLIAYSQHADNVSMKGIFYVLVATFMGAFYTVMQKRFLSKFHPIEVTSFIIWGGTLIMLYYSPALVHEITKAKLSATVIAIYMGIFPAAIAYVAWSHVINNIPASKASIYLYLLPLVSTVMGIFFLHEIPPLLSIIGGLIALIGALVTTWLYDGKTTQ
jgi:drug/metabolite transporter (DMT)-like permease